ncbi:DUF29 domain-containing protein [Geminocystis sp. GBBB08]|uniref:DUF29 domain-containing protein n=1 Tax=Geminocystis sp. GBBB08 TaxID=2604140 RepID=UPI0027E36E45|nr:DUF29 domain-containing protein [Geminocystis sp. GBBB08]MBL1208771.1 DUF29 domain-containing protein [Geminocystis sp. GBBB08]
MIIDTQKKLKELYEIDDYLWLEETINLLKENRLNELDLENLIEELESLARRDKLALQSLLEQIIRHLLLIEYWQDERERSYRHWRSEVTSFRGQISDRMTTNFYHYLTENKSSIYRKARKYVIDSTGLETFPPECPYTLDKLLDEDWFPER